MGHLCERCEDETLPGLTLTRQHAAEVTSLQHSAGTGCCLGRALILGVSEFRAATNLSPRHVSEVA